MVLQSNFDKVDKGLQDELWLKIVYEIEMNYSLESLQYGYAEMQKKKTTAVTADRLRSLGYTEDDIARSDTR